MNRFRTIGILALTLTALAMAQDAVTLRRELKSNTKDTYKVEMTSKTSMDIPQMGPQEMTMKAWMNYALKTGEVKETKADLDTVITDLKFEMEGPMADMMKQQGGMPEMPKEMLFKGQIDNRNRISDLKFQGKMDMMTMSMVNQASTIAMFVEFPEGAIKVGDTWKVTIPKNAFVGNDDTQMDAKLIGEEGGKWKVQMAGTMKLKPDMKEIMKGQDPTGTGMEMDMNVTGTMKLETQALIDKATGKTVEMTTKVDSKSVMEITNLGMSMDQSSNGTIKLTLQPGQ